MKIKMIKIMILIINLVTNKMRIQAIKNQNKIRKMYKKKEKMICELIIDIIIIKIKMKIIYI